MRKSLFARSEAAFANLQEIYVRKAIFMPYQNQNSNNSHSVRNTDQNAEDDIPGLDGGYGIKPPKHSTAFAVKNKIFRATTLAVTAILVFAATLAAAIYINFDGKVQRNSIKMIAQPGAEGENAASVDPYSGKPLNILVLGEDSREGEENKKLAITATEDSTEGGNSDTAMIIQLAADRSYINIVSIPRDSIVNVPACNTSKGQIPAAQRVMFNSIFAKGYNTGGDLTSAVSCTVNAVSVLTGLNIDQFIVADFAGLKSMIDALGGVDVCIPQRLDDGNTNIHLDKGMQHLDGTVATEYARIRHGIGDGSDIGRTTRQQYLIKKVIQEASKKNVFTQINQLYQLASAGIDALHMSTGLAKVPTLVGLAGTLKNFDPDKIYSQTVPIKPDPADPNRVVWTEEAASIWKKLKDGKRLTEEDSSNSSGSSDSGSSDSSDSASASPQPAPSETSAVPQKKSTLNAQTELLEYEDGTLQDPKTGGYVDPDTGTIANPTTGFAIGLADKYLDLVICKTS